MLRIREQLSNRKQPGIKHGIFRLPKGWQQGAPRAFTGTSSWNWERDRRDKAMFVGIKLFIIVIIKLGDSERPETSAESEIICWEMQGNVCVLNKIINPAPIAVADVLERSLRSNFLAIQKSLVMGLLECLIQCCNFCIHAMKTKRPNDFKNALNTALNFFFKINSISELNSRA